MGTALLLRRKPSGYRAAAQLAMSAARGSARQARRGSRELWAGAADHGIERRLRGYLRDARSQIDDAVQSELRDLRRALRKQRKRLGV